MKKFLILLGFLSFSPSVFGAINPNIHMPPIGQLHKDCDNEVDVFVKEFEEAGFIFLTQEKVSNREEFDKITALIAPDNSVLLMIMSKGQCAVDSYFVKGK